MSAPDRSEEGRAAPPDPTRPRLSTIFIDVPDASHEQTVGFWSRALGARAVPDPEHPEFTELADGRAPLRVVVQRVDDAPRVHLDLASDDVEATVAHLVDLGAERVDAMDDWVVLRDPAGNLFCVVPPGYGDDRA